MKNYFRYIIVPVLVGLLIFYGTCLITPDDIPKLPNLICIPWDKLVHFGMFFSLSIVIFIFYDKLHKGKPVMKKWLFWGLILPIIYGGAIELLQEYFFSRNGEWLDFVADVLGSLSALVLIIFIKKHWKKGKKTIFV